MLTFKFKPTVFCKRFLFFCCSLMFLITCAVVFLTVKSGLSAVSAADRAEKQAAEARASSSGMIKGSKAEQQSSDQVTPKTSNEDEGEQEEEVPPADIAEPHATIWKITLSYWQVWGRGRMNLG